MLVVAIHEVNSIGVLRMTASAVLLRHCSCCSSRALHPPGGAPTSTDCEASAAEAVAAAAAGAAAAAATAVSASPTIKRRMMGAMSGRKHAQGRLTSTDVAVNEQDVGVEKSGALCFSPASSRSNHSRTFLTSLSAPRSIACRRLVVVIPLCGASVA
jgi:hypothetical protein